MIQYQCAKPGKPVAQCLRGTVMTTTRKPAVEPPISRDVTLPYRLALNVRALDMTEDQFLRFCADNGDLRMELTAEKELIIMPPAGGITGGRNSELAVDLGIWSRRDGTGKTFDSSTGFTLPNGAIRSPDASWILLPRWEALTDAEQDRFPPICPDFVIELRSPSDRLADVQAKMAEYIENGALLGWLIDPQNRRVHVYRAGQPVEILEQPESVSGDPVLLGFVLDLSNIW